MNEIKGYYLEKAWKVAFENTVHRIVFDTSGNVFKNSISFENLVNTFDGKVGMAGRPTDGQITIWINPDDTVNGQTGSIQTIIEEKTDTHNLTGGVNPTTNEWLHFSIKIDSVNKTLTLKINDVLVQTITLSGELNLFNEAKSAVLFRYLNKNFNDEHKYDGMIDDFRIYAKALSDQEDTDIYKWGNQSLQFQKKVYIPKQAVSRGCTVGFKFQSDDYMQLRTFGIKYRNKQMR